MVVRCLYWYQYMLGSKLIELVRAFCCRIQCGDNGTWEYDF